MERFTFTTVVCPNARPGAPTLSVSEEPIFKMDYTVVKGLSVVHKTIAPSFIHKTVCLRHLWVIQYLVRSWPEVPCLNTPEHVWEYKLVEIEKVKIRTVQLFPTNCVPRVSMVHCSEGHCEADYLATKAEPLEAYLNKPLKIQIHPSFVPWLISKFYSMTNCIYKVKLLVNMLNYRSSKKRTNYCT